MSVKPLKVLAIIVTHNGEQWISRCINSLLSSEHPLDVFIIDNASTDNTVQLIEQLGNYQKFIKGQNIGFAAANNVGIKYALSNHYDGVFLLNHDAWIEPDVVTKLIQVSSLNKNLGVISPIHLNGSGECLDYNFTNYISSPSDNGRKLYTDLLKKNQLAPYYTVNFVNAACWYLPIKTLDKCGNFDQHLFPHYGEDDNFLSRISTFGFKTCIVPSAFIYHDREDRNGKQSKNPFSKNYSISRFIKLGANFNEEEANFSMNQLLKNNRNQIIKSALILRLNKTFELLALRKELTKAKNTIKFHRKLYKKGHHF